MTTLPNPAATDASCGLCSAPDIRRLEMDTTDCDYVVALAGNPNTGKSTVFNSLTGLRQHTGNWPGKTVGRAEGVFQYNGKKYKIVDLPGTYSLLSASTDEEIARDFILFGRPDVTAIVVDATRLERNLNLVLQVLEITDRAVLCVNLMDEARRNGMTVDVARLEHDLGIPVVGAAARRKEGLDLLQQRITEVASGRRCCTPHRIQNESPALKQALNTLVEKLQIAYPDLANARWVALRLLEHDTRMIDAVRTGELVRTAERLPSERTGHCDDILTTATRLRWTLGDNFHDSLMESIYEEAARIAGRAVHVSEKKPGRDWDRLLDRLVTSRLTGFPIMFLLLALVFWITISGANVPSSMLSYVLIDTIHPLLNTLASVLALPWWLSGVLIDGCYLATAWVVSVMLPPMAIFFPLFTLCEDFGYLPRVAFNLDNLFKKVGAHGKQALTMSMGYGCNAAGAVACRIIDSPRERLLAIITNNFAVCNGRWPTLFLIATIFFGSAFASPVIASVVSSAVVMVIVLIGIGFTFLTSWVLSNTVLRGQASIYSLELPPYRPPKILETLYTSLIDRTVYVLWRAIVFAFPAGAVIWLTANVTIGGISLGEHLIRFLDPFGFLIGLNGVILLAYIIAIPANEIVIPTILMLTVLVGGIHGVGEGSGVLFEMQSHEAIADILRQGGWTMLTAINLLLFCLLHNPCSTAIYTIYKETGSGKWAAVSALLPVAIGIIVCFFVTHTWRLIQLLL